jgi:hypothetical protein
MYYLWLSGSGVYRLALIGLMIAIHVGFVAHVIRPNASHFSKLKGVKQHCTMRR